MSDTTQAATETTTTEATPSEAPAPPTGAQQPPAARRIKVIDGGKEEELDANGVLERLIAVHGEDGVRNIAALSTKTRRALSEAGVTRKQLEEAARDLDDPRKIFALFERKLGRDGARRAIEEWYASDLEERSLDPREREQRKRLSGLEERERALAEREAKLRAQDEEREAARLQPQLGRQFSEALRRSGADTATPLMLAKMAAMVEAEIAEARAANIRLTPEDWQQIVNDAARAVASKHYDEVASDFARIPEAKRAAIVQQAIKALPPEQLAAVLGPEGLRAFRRWDVEQHKAKNAPQARTTQAPRQAASVERKPVHVDEWLRERW